MLCLDVGLHSIVFSHPDTLQTEKLNWEINRVAPVALLHIPLDGHQRQHSKKNK